MSHLHFGAASAAPTTQIKRGWGCVFLKKFIAGIIKDSHFFFLIIFLLFFPKVLFQFAEVYFTQITEGKELKLNN